MVDIRTVEGWVRLKTTPQTHTSSIPHMLVGGNPTLATKQSPLTGLFVFTGFTIALDACRIDTVMENTMDAKERLQGLTDQMVARGVRDVKFAYASDFNGGNLAGVTTESLANEVSDLFEAVLDGRYTTLPPLGDSFRTTIPTALSPTAEAGGDELLGESQHEGYKTSGTPSQ